MSELRDEIAELVYVYANRRESGFAYPTDQMVANEILDLVREALLSDEAVMAADKARDGTAVWDFLEQEIVEGGEGPTYDIITAALDAVTGEGDR